MAGEVEDLQNKRGLFLGVDHINCGMSLKVELIIATLLIGSWAGAEPVYSLYYPDNEIKIVDKTMGAKVFMRENKLTYIDAKKNILWSKNISKGKGKFNSIAFSDSGLYLSTIGAHDSDKVLKYSLVGRILWQRDVKFAQGIDLRQLYDDKFLSYQYIYGEPMRSGWETVYAKNGKPLSVQGLVKMVSGNKLLLQDIPDNFMADSPTEIEAFLNSFQTTQWYTFNLKTNQKSNIYTMGNRKDCGNFLPGWQEHAASSKANQAALGKYRENIIRGEYIYAHRADHCGKFTYRFHWTDSQNPGPIILPGWQ